MKESELEQLEAIGRGDYGWAMTSWMRELVAKAVAELKERSAEHQRER